MRISMKPKLEKKTMEEGFQDFITQCKVKNLSERTIVYYKQCNKEFTAFYNGEIANINIDVVSNFILYLKDKPSIQDTTINIWLRGLRVIFYYWMGRNYMEKFKISLIKTEKNIKETYTEAELKKLLKKPNMKICNFSEYREWVIVNYLLSTGNRINSLVNVKIKNINFESGCVLIEKTKNKKQQMIPLSKTLEKLLMEYLEFRNGEAEDYLFCSIQGMKLTTTSLAHSIAKYNEKRGVTKTSVHLFRHTFAKMWILAGGDIFRLQKILGHSSLEVVKEYVNMFGDDLKRDFDKFNPLEQLSITNEYLKMKK